MKLPAARKARGELAEAIFLAKAMRLGFVVSKPFGDNAKYDFVLDAGRGRISRVQVKSAWVRSRVGYQIGAGPAFLRRFGFRRPYRRSEIDFLVSYIAPEDTWFVIPVKAVLKCHHFALRLVPTERFASYREAWNLLR